MKAATTITCTKTDFHKRLFTEFVEPVRGTEHDTAELNEVLCGLVVQANQQRGTFSGYNAYLDLEFIVTPDEPIKIELTESGKAKVAKFLATMRDIAKDAPDMLDRSPAEIREAIAKPVSCMHCGERFATVAESIEHAHLSTVEADEYQPSAAIAAMIAHVTANPTWSVGERYRITVLIVIAVRAERPDWSDAQARDWLRTQVQR